VASGSPGGGGFGGVSAGSTPSAIDFKLMFILGQNILKLIEVFVVSLKAYGVPIPSAIAISSCLLLSLLISKLSSNYLVLTSYWTSAVLEVFSGFPLGVLGS
jgi:hypothetical protein